MRTEKRTEEKEIVVAMTYSPSEITNSRGIWDLLAAEYDIEKYEFEEIQRTEDGLLKAIFFEV